MLSFVGNDTKAETGLEDTTSDAIAALGSGTKIGCKSYSRNDGSAFCASATVDKDLNVVTTQHVHHTGRHV